MRDSEPSGPLDHVQPERSAGVFRSWTWRMSALIAVVLAIFAFWKTSAPPPAAGPPVPPHPPSAPAIHGAGEGRKVSFAGGMKSFHIASLPHLGPATAEHVLVEYFDYRCEACVTLSGYLDGLLKKHPDKLCVITLPVPLEPSCNPVMTAGDPRHEGSCELARLALAVWRQDPAAFPDFHHLLLQGTTPAEARAVAAGIIGADAMEGLEQDSWITALLAANASDWVTLSKKTNQLPKLLIRDRRILHGLPSGEADFIQVIEKELGL